MSGTGLLLALASRAAVTAHSSATAAAAAAAVATPRNLATVADNGFSSSTTLSSSSTTTSSRGQRGQQEQRQQQAPAPQAGAAAAAAGPGPGSTRLFAQLAASSTAATGSSSALTGWHQRQATAAYRAPIKGKQGPQAKGGKGGGGGASDASSAAAGGASAAAAFDDDGPGAGDAVRVVLQAVTNVTPHLDVRTIRSATKTTYVPGVMPPDKGRSLALHWLVAAAEARKKSSAAPFAECLALELLLAYQKRGPARQKRDDLHKLALQNRANLHMRWW